MRYINLSFLLDVCFLGHSASWESYITWSARTRATRQRHGDRHRDTETETERCLLVYMVYDV